MNKAPLVGLGLLALAAGGAYLLSRGDDDTAAAPPPPPTQAQVAALVDGRTLDVRAGDRITRIRLGELATPPAPRPGQPTPCLSTEASQQLTSIAPAGTELTLSYDEDRFGRTAAQATTGDGRLVNAEMVRAGLAQAIPRQSDDPTSLALAAAAKDAETNGRGIHDPAIECTVPGRVRAITARVAALPASPPPGLNAVQLTLAATAATDTRMAAEELVSAFAQNRQEIVWLGLGTQERAQLRDQVQTAVDTANASEAALWQAEAATANQSATRAAGQAEATLIATTLAKIRKAEADRAAAIADRAAAARKAQADAAAEAQARADAARKDKAERDKADRDKADRDRADRDKADRDKGNRDDKKKDDGKNKDDDSGGQDAGGDSNSHHGGGSGKNDDKDGGKKDN